MKTAVWQPSNVYRSAKLGKGVSVGAFTEIGENVEVGGGTRIGALCFIPEKVKIGKGCFIGPHVCFTNDLYPPSDKAQWLPTIVQDGARIGAGVTVLCGVTIGRGALVGCGSVVTKNVPCQEIWAGNPAHKIGAI